MHTHFLSPARLLILPIVVSLFVGCSVIRTVAGPTRTDTQIVAAQGATSAQVELNIGAGELKLSGETDNADTLAKAQFTYNVDRWQPKVDYNIGNNRGTLVIAQPNTTSNVLGGVRNEWDVKLNNHMPIDLKVNLGAGKGMLNLSGLNLESVDIAGGAGELQLDVSGIWTKTTQITVSGGVGKVSVRLPKSVGARVTANAGLGRVNANGMSKDGDAYINAAYDKTAVILNLTISAGVGEINLSVE